MSISKKTLLDLDDYSLRHICTFLPLIDKANVGRVCSRLRDIIDHLIESLEVNFNNIYETQPFSVAKDFFTDYGKQVKKIFMQFDAVEEMVEFYYLVPRNCFNIEKIHYNFPYYVDTEIMEMMFAASKNIRNLFCNARDLRDSHMLLISKLPELEILNIEENRDITGLHFDKLTKLKDLNVQGCPGLQPKHFIDICKANKLRKLNIVECELLDDEAFQTLVKTQTELDEFKVTHCYPHGNVDVVASLENLRRLSIQYLCQRPHKITSLLSLLAQHRRQSLQILEIERPTNLTLIERGSILKLTNLTEIAFIADNELSNAFLSELSKSCLKLRRVDLSECTNFTTEGVADLVKHLKFLEELAVRRCSQLGHEMYQKLVEIKQQISDSRKLTVFAWATGLNEFDLDKVQGYDVNKNLVELCFSFGF